MQLKEKNKQKAKAKTIRSLTFNVPKEVYDAFLSKIHKDGYNKEKILLEMVKEWTW